MSGFQDEKHGSGSPLTYEQPQMNSVRNTRDHELLGQKSKGGFWGYPESKRQVEDMLDVHELLERDLQVVCGVDHSSGHARHREDGLHASNKNVRFGCRQQALRHSVMTEGFSGLEEAVMYLATVR